ncbi:MAG TPA: pectate lyase [Vicinamibacterales bacterium]|nr:pectate lyase [Vicinamibacterales bacterium]
MRTQAGSFRRGPRALARVVIGACAAALAATSPAAQVPWSRVLDQQAEWYGSAEARSIADSVLLHQRANGGWPKDIDMSTPPSGAAARPSEPDSTIDNGATVTQIRLLDRVWLSTTNARYRDAAARGLDYLFLSQYANGGWPQIYPLRKDYTRRITFNDDAMAGVLLLLDDLVAGRALASAGDVARARAVKAIDTATSVILRSQVRVNGRLTAWCAQHDEVTLEPAPARSYEHVSLSGRETVDIVRFLMRRPPTPEVVAAVEAAVEWLRSVPIRGRRLDRRADPAGRRAPDLELVVDPAAPALWARFYQIGTNRPIYSGRDGVVRYDISEIEAERRNGYAWLGPWPAALVDAEYPAWRARVSGLSVK